MSKSMKICVFCASSQSVAENYRQAMHDLGVALAKEGHSLVFGGYDSGLMGVTAHAFRENGGKVYGVVPDDVSDFKARRIFDADELFEVNTITQRKSQMESLAEAYIVGPGAYGTFDELFNVLVELKIGSRNKAPVIIYNVDGYFDIFIEMCNKMVEQNLMPKEDLDLFVVANNVNEVLIGLAQVGKL